MRNRLSHILALGVALIVAGVIVTPIVWGVFTSLKTRVDALANPPLLAFRPTLENYTASLQLTEQGRSLWNSLVIATCSSLLAVLVSFPLSYVLSRIDPHKGISQTLNIVSARMMPPAMLIIPLYLVFREWSLMDGYLGIILVHAAVAIPFAVVALKIHIDQIPRTLDEACLLEGDTYPHFLLRQVSRAGIPGILVAGGLCFVTSWNEYYFVSRLTGHDYSTFTVAVTAFVTPHGTNWGRVTALASIGVLPGIVAALFGGHVLKVSR